MKKNFRYFAITAALVIGSFQTISHSAELPNAWASAFMDTPHSATGLTTLEQDKFQGAAGPLVGAGIGALVGAGAHIAGSLANGTTPTMSGVLLAGAGGAAAGLVPGLGLNPVAATVAQGAVGIGTSAAVGVSERRPFSPYGSFGPGMSDCDPVRCNYRNGRPVPWNYQGR